MIVSLCVSPSSASTRGADLLPLLSSLLNRGSAAVAPLALDGIRALIGHRVIDPRTTVRVLTPRMAAEPRSEVVGRFAGVLALVAGLRGNDDEAKDFREATLSR